MKHIKLFESFINEAKVDFDDKRNMRWNIQAMQGDLDKGLVIMVATEYEKGQPSWWTLAIVADDEIKFQESDLGKIPEWVKKKAYEEAKRYGFKNIKEVNEAFVNEAVKLSVDMPASMKKWIMGEVKSNPDTWSNELTDLTNAIVSAHRESDLDLSKSDKGPEWIDIRKTPVDELTTRCIETINAIWPKMGEWAKEDIYTDYENWFKVGKKDREHYGEK
jgi:hypothetical protein